MDVNTEAKRIMAVSISKLYASRSQRGGMRLHRSLLLSMVMRSARDIYHSACLAKEKEELCTEAAQPATVEPMETSGPGVVQAEVIPQTESPLTPTPEPQITPEPACKAGQSRGNKTGAADKENRSPPVSPPDRHSRKRRGKASVTPDFLPSKRARLELGGEERHAVALRSGRCSVVDSLANLNTMNRVIAAF